MSESGTVSLGNRRRLRVVVCVIVYVAAFVVTHLPPSRVPGRGVVPDWVMHGIGYLGLGLVLSWGLGFRRIGKWMAAAWVGLLAYALFDEVTQPIVGRSCELRDWVMDALGALVGIGLWAAVVCRRSG